MSGDWPFVSVVIPTHDRLPILRQCLCALAVQRYPGDRMEVIVVADGCSDGTVEALSAMPQPVHVSVVSQPSMGAAAARNRGARAAHGEILLFLDDDVIASEGLIAAHAASHSRDADRVVVGPYLLDPPSGTDYLQQVLSGFWRRLFETMAMPGHVPRYEDIVAGNLSMHASTFHRMGGFSEAFPSCGVEDYELGVRLLEDGVRSVFAPDAYARHLETTDLPRSLARNRRGGAASVTLVRLHPFLLPATRLEKPTGWALRLAFRMPRTGKVIAALAFRLLGWAQRMRLRKIWMWIYGRLRSYWFWHGVRDELPTEHELAAFIAGVSRAQELPMNRRAPVRHRATGGSDDVDASDAQPDSARR